MATVTIYTTPTCGYCKQAKAYFTENKVEFTEVDVAANPEEQQVMLEKSGQLGTPVITIDDEVIVGFDQPAIAKILGL